jgi:hypothetical protein
MTAVNRKAWRGIVAVVGLVVVLASVVAFAKSARLARVLRGGAARWREIHTPGAGREQALPPEVLNVVKAMQAAGWRSYRFGARLENNVEISPYIAEAAWPITCRLSDDNVVGYLKELVDAGPSCDVIRVVGEFALGHCRS